MRPSWVRRAGQAFAAGAILLSVRANSRIYSPRRFVVYFRPMTGRIRVVGALIACVALTSTARANPEPTALYEGRYAAMGGNAVAFADNAVAVFQNPAGLSHVDHASFDVTTSLLYVRYEVPFAGPGSEQRSPPIFGPPPFIGGAGRVHDRIVVGGAVYFSTAFGGRFRDIRRLDDYIVASPCSNSPIGQVTNCTNSATPVTEVTTQSTSNQAVTLFIIEAAASIGVKVTDDLRVGLSLRLPWAQQSTASLQEALVGAWRDVDQTVQGFGFPSALVGVQWDVSDAITLGAVYRMRADIHMSGETRTNIGYDVQDEVNVIHATTQWRTPHMFRVGVAARLLERRLLLSAEFRAQFHGRVNTEQVFHLSDDSGLVETVGLTEIRAPFNWYNVYYPSIGAQYEFAPNWFARWGMSLGRSATPRTTLSQFTPPPGLQYGLSAGFGGIFGHWAIDFAYQFATGAPTVVDQRNAVNCSRDAPAKSGCDGRYLLDAHSMILSATFNN